MPESIVIPVLSYANVEAAVDWLCAAFGFAVRLRIPGHRVQLRVAGGAGAVVVAENSSAAIAEGRATGAVMIRVASVDDHFAIAKAAGAKILSSPDVSVWRAPIFCRRSW